MKVAEQEMQQDPQVAFDILNNINHEMSSYSKKVRMEYELLLIQALDKTNHSLANYKSKIDSTLDYFQNYGSYLQIAKAYYYKAGYFRDKDDKINALRWYQKAWLEVNKTPLSNGNERGLASVICAQISNMLYLTSNYTESLKYAIYEYKYSVTTIGKFESACDLARGYKGIADTDSSVTDSIVKYYDIAFDLSKTLQLKGPNYQHNMLNQVSFFLDLGIKSKANERLEVLDIGSFHKEPSGFYVLGVIYDGLGKTDSALYYYNKTTETKNFGQVAAAYNRLMMHEYKKGNWKAAADYGLKFKVANDSAIKQDDAERVSRKLENQETANLATGYKELKEKSDTQGRANNVLTIIVAVMLCGGGTYIFIIKKKQESRLSKLQREGRKTKERLEKLKAEYASKTERLLEMESENAQLKAKFQEYEAKERLNLPQVKDFIDNIKMLLTESRQMTTKMYEQLPQIVSEIVPGAERKLNEYFSTNSMYSNVLGLFLLGFRNAEISRLTGNSKASITKYWSKICIDILGEGYKGSEREDLVPKIKEALAQDSVSQVGQ